MNDELPVLEKWKRLRGAEREGFQSRCVQLYVDEELSIREIADRTGRSYGAVHKMLNDAQVRMRPRGNPMRS